MRLSLAYGANLMAESEHSFRRAKNLLLGSVDTIIKIADPKGEETSTNDCRSGAGSSASLVAPTRPSLVSRILTKPSSQEIRSESIGTSQSMPNAVLHPGG